MAKRANWGFWSITKVSISRHTLAKWFQDEQCVCQIWSCRGTFWDLMMKTLVTPRCSQMEEQSLFCIEHLNNQFWSVKQCIENHSRPIRIDKTGQIKSTQSLYANPLSSRHIRNYYVPQFFFKRYVFNIQRFIWSNDTMVKRGLFSIWREHFFGEAAIET